MTKKYYTEYETYRAYANDGELLYVGRSVCAISRMISHSYNSEWYRSMSRLEVDRHESFEEAERHEKHLINTLKPTWNVAHAKGKVRSKKSKSRRAVRSLSADQAKASVSVVVEYVKSENFQASYGVVFLLMLGTAKYGGRVPLTDAQISSDLGVSRRTVSRAVKHLIGSGMIKEMEREGRMCYYLASPAAQKGNEYMKGTKKEILAIKKTTRTGVPMGLIQGGKQ